MRMTTKKPWFLQFVLLLFFLFFRACLSISSDSISHGQSLSGNQTITSQGGVFELGFFKPGNSLNYYIGIWYKIVPNKTVVWVANRNQPVSNSSTSALKLTLDGTVVLFNQSNAEVWSTNSTSGNPNSTIAVLLDSGNLVIRDVFDNSSVIWQSFDHPTDHWLPGGKLGYNKVTNEKQNFVPWRSSENPAPGIFSLELQKNGINHLLLWNESVEYWRSQYWDEKSFTENKYVKMAYITNENESYYTYEATDPSTSTRYLLDATGQLKQFVWRRDIGLWVLFGTWPEQQCKVSYFCGSFSFCKTRSLAPCDCIQGFEPKASRDWEMGYYYDGCVRKTPLQCVNGSEGFSIFSDISFPDNKEYLSIVNAEECKLACLKNCLCSAYSYDNNGCFVWRGDLLNAYRFPYSNPVATSLSVRLAASELVGIVRKEKGKSIWLVIGSIGGFIILVGIVLVTIYRRRQLARKLEAVDDSLMLFKYQVLRKATKNFSEKLGKGGFGSVFKGTLPNSTAIAVKELNCLPKQGEKQFRAEVNSLGIIQHINLVRLKGFCAEASKRFLVYEYMPNGSLESHLFRKSTNILYWKTRYNIAIGTARGLSYLHEKCRDCIIHCDIKPENILLDANYNPKVADFGLAKVLGREFSRVLTTIRGTIGYLAPEWISGDPITPKADVFSYGMLLFELISGRRNTGFLGDDTNDFFPSRVANTINKGEDVLTLLDDRLEGNADIDELSRACNVACWCIQDDVDRPTMGKVVQILEGVCEVGMAPIPRFIQRLTESPARTMVYQETSSSFSLQARDDVSNISQAQGTNLR